jgi:hypothetical protein
MREPSRRRVPAVAALVAGAVAALLLAGAAAAHGGDKVGEAVAGPYRVQLFAAGIEQDGANGIDYTAYVRRVSTGFPVDDATVRITVERTDGTTVGPKDASGFANGYDVVVPAADVTEREGQRVTVAIDGPDGAGQATIVVRTSLLPGGASAGGGGAAGSGGDGGSSQVLWIAIGGVVAVLLVAMVVVSVRGDRGRARGSASGGG